MCGFFCQWESMFPSINIAAFWSQILLHEVCQCLGNDCADISFLLKTMITRPCTYPLLVRNQGHLLLLRRKKRLIGGRIYCFYGKWERRKRRIFFRGNNKIAGGLLRQNNSWAYIYELRGGLISCFLPLWCERGPGVAKKRRRT